MSPIRRIQNRTPKIFFLSLVAFLFSFLPFDPAHPLQVFAGQPNSESNLKGPRGAERVLIRERWVEPNLYAWNDPPFYNPASASFHTRRGYSISQDEQRGMSEFASIGEAIIDDFLVNDDTTGGCGHSQVAIARDLSGNFIITWTDFRNGNSDVYAQRYDSLGTPVGSSFKVNDDTGILSTYSPGIGMDGSGNFVISWEDYRNNGYDIYAQRYDSAGVPLGSNFKVNDDPGTPVKWNPCVAMDSLGNFVVVWQFRMNGYDIYAQSYDCTGTPLGSNFRVNDDSGGAWNTRPAITGGGSGNFVITWHDNRSGNYCIYAQMYMYSGTPSGSNFQVNDDTGDVWKGSSAIDMNGSGNFIIAWEDSRGGIWAQRYNSIGTPLGSNFQVYNDGSPYWDAPDIAIDETGNFVIAWEDKRNGRADIYAQRYDSTGTPSGPNLKVNDDAGNPLQRYPAIATDGSGNFIIAWEDYRNAPCNNELWPSADIYAQRYDFSGTPSGSNFNVNDDIGSSYQWYPSIAADNSGNFIMTWEDYRGGDFDIYAQRYNFSGTPLTANFKVNDDVGCAGQAKPAIAVDDSGNFIITWESGDIYAQRYNSTGTPLEPNFKVSGFFGGYPAHYSPAVAIDGSGNFVITWRFTQHYHSYASYIYAQRYDALGVPVGSNFQVNNNAGTGWEASPAITIDRFGNFIITWHDWHPDIYAQRYDSSGTPLGSNFRVNDDSGSEDQMYPTIAIDHAGNFVITWQDERNENWNIYAQRYDSSGTPLGSNFKVNNDSGIASQMYPAIAMDDSGNFIIAWEDLRNGYYNPDIHAQRYNSSGDPLGSNYLVPNPSYASFAQVSPAVAASGDSIYFTWQDNRRAKGWDIYAKVVDWVWTEVEEDQEVNLPNSFELSQNYPNPFNPVTRIQYTVGSRQTPIHTTLIIYNILGQKVRTLVDEEKTPGNYNITWDGKDNSGNEVASGIYFYQLKTKDFTATRKMILLR